METCRNVVSSSIDDHEMQGAEALGSEFMRMASVTLKGIKKIYPFSGDDNKKKKKKKNERCANKRRVKHFF